MDSPEATGGKPALSSPLVIPIILALLVIVGFALRFPNLGALGLIGDEGHQGLAVQGILEHGTPIVPSGRVYVRSIIYLYTQALSAKVFGLNEFALRFPSLLFSLPSLIVVYLLGSTLFDRRVGLLSAFILTLSAWEIEYARDARMYTAFQMLYTLSLLFFYKGFIVGRRTDRLLVPILFTLTFIFHRMGVTLLFAFTVPFLIQAYSTVRKWTLPVYGLITYALFRISTYLTRSLIVPPPGEQSGGAAPGGAGTPSSMSDVIHDKVFTPPIALLKQLAGDHTLVFAPLAVLFAAAMLFVLYKFATSPSRRLRWAMTVPIIASCFLYQFTLALLFFALFAVLFCRDLKSLRDGEIVFALILSTFFFLFYLAYALLAPPQISFFTISNTFFGYPNIRGFFLRWLLDGWPRFSFVLGIGAVLLTRKFFMDKRDGSALFLITMTIFPVLFCGVIFWIFYSARYIFHLYPLLVIAFTYTLFRAIDAGLGAVKPLAAVLARRPIVHNMAVGAVAIALATVLSQDIYLADALAAGKRTCQTAKNPSKAITNSATYATYHQDYKTPAQYLAGQKKPGDIVILMARAHVPPIYHFYLGAIDYVVLERGEPQFLLKKTDQRPRHYTTGSELIVSAESLNRAIDENRGKTIWLVTDSHLMVDFTSEEILEEIEAYPRRLMYTGLDGSTQVYRLELSEQG